MESLASKFLPSLLTRVNVYNMNTTKYAITMFGGGWGRQFVAVLKEEENRVRVRKWRRSGMKWTGPVWVPRSQITNPNATAEMARAFKADLGAL